MEREPVAKPAALIPGVHRVIRMLDTGEGPFRGALVVDGDGVAVMVDTDVLAGWRGWSYAGCEHVAGPLDLVRRTDGHDVLLPWCTELVDAFIGRRAVADALLTAGEMSTLVVSLLRGMDEVFEHSTDQPSGEWWLTDAGRPLFVIGEGNDVKGASARIIERLRRDCGDRALGRVLAAVHGVLVEGRARPRPSRDQLASWEVELFEHAAPRALQMQQHGPALTRGIEVLQHARPAIPAAPTRRAARVREGRERNSPRSIVRWGAKVPEGLRALMASGEGARWRPVRPGDGAAAPSGRAAAPGRTASRRRSLLVAGGAAAVVLVGGLLWPGGATGESSSAERPAAGTGSLSGSADDEVGVSESQTPDPEPSETEETEADDAGADDPVSEAVRLLSTISECAQEGDLLCPAAVADGTPGIVEALTPAWESKDAPEIALVDSYGDVAVVRLSFRGAESSPSEETATPDGSADAGADAEGEADTGQKMVVLVRLNEKWLIRDVYDVADQPQ